MSASLLLRLILWSWLAAAVYAGHTRLLQRVSPVALPAIVLLLATLALMAYFRLPALRAWMDTLDLRRLVLLHVTRLIGVVYLLLHHRGQLPYAFAAPAGIGDVVIATLALPVALAPISASARQRVISIWNMAALADLLLILATATRLHVTDPSAIQPLTELPLSFLLMFLLPLLLAINVIIFIRLSRPCATS